MTFKGFFSSKTDSTAGSTRRRIVSDFSFMHLLRVSSGRKVVSGAPDASQARRDRKKRVRWRPERYGHDAAYLGVCCVVHGLRRADMPAHRGHTEWANAHGISSRNCTLVWSFRIQTNGLLEDDYGSSCGEQSKSGLKDAL